MASLSSIHSINNMAAISSGHTVNRISSWTRNKTQFMGSGMDWRNPWLAKMSKGKKKRKHWQSSQLFHTRKIYWNPSNWLVCLFVWGFGGSGWGFYYWVNTNCYNYTAVGCLFISYLNSSPSQHTSTYESVSKIHLKYISHGNENFVLVITALLLLIAISRNITVAIFTTNFKKICGKLFQLT